MICEIGYLAISYQPTSHEPLAKAGKLKRWRLGINHHLEYNKQSLLSLNRKQLRRCEAAQYFVKNCFVKMRGIK